MPTTTATTTSAINPFVILNDYVSTEKPEQPQDSATTVLAKFEIHSDCSPSDKCAAAERHDDTLSALSTEPLDTSEIPDSLVFFDAQDPLITAFEDLQDAIHAALPRQSEPAPIAEEPPPSSWQSTFAAPLVGVYNAASNLVQRLTRTDVPAPIQNIDTNQHLERAAELSFKIEDQLHELDKDICAALGIPPPTLDAGRINPTPCTNWDQLRNFSAHARGFVTALLDTAPGVASGVAVGGVATTGILGIGGGVAAFCGGLILTLREARLFSGRQTNATVQNLIQSQLPEIQKNLEALDTYIRREEHRHTIGQRLMATMVMRNDYCRTLGQAIMGAEAALKVRLCVITASEFENGVPAPAVASPAPLPVAPQVVSHSDVPPRSTVLTQLAQTRDALYDFIASLIKGFNALSARVFPTADARDEKAFKEEYKTLLQELSSKHDSTLVPGVDVIAFENLKNGGASTTVTDDALRADIHRGENLTRAILSSGPNFGAVEYTARAGEFEHKYAVPSHLTTVRSIARYIDAQAISNTKNPADAAKAPALSLGQDGVYTIADPDRNLYSFLASAPTAYADFSDPADKGLSPGLTDTGIGRMTITDYSSTFPGGANQMVFEAKIDETGAHILTVRFVKQDDESRLKPGQVTAVDMIKHHQRKLVLGQTPAETPDFTGMSIAEIETYLKNMTQVCEEQMALLQADSRQFDALNEWENPMFPLDLTAA